MIILTMMPMKQCFDWFKKWNVPSSYLSYVRLIFRSRRRRERREEDAEQRIERPWRQGLDDSHRSLSLHFDFLLSPTDIQSYSRSISIRSVLPRPEWSIHLFWSDILLFFLLICPPIQLSADRCSFLIRGISCYWSSLSREYSPRSVAWLLFSIFPNGESERSQIGSFTDSFDPLSSRSTWSCWWRCSLLFTLS